MFFLFVALQIYLSLFFFCRLFVCLFNFFLFCLAHTWTDLRCDWSFLMAARLISFFFLFLFICVLRAAKFIKIFNASVRKFIIYLCARAALESCAQFAELWTQLPLSLDSWKFILKLRSWSWSLAFLYLFFFWFPFVATLVISLDDSQSTVSATINHVTHTHKQGKGIWNELPSQCM